MTNRRQFIQTGTAIGAAWLSAGRSVSAAVETSIFEGLDLERFVFDNRFEASVTAAARASLAGVQLAETDGDMTELWYRDLDLRWKAAPMTLAGVTTARGLFVLETLAHDRRMRVVQRIEHVPNLQGLKNPQLAEETLITWVIAPARPAGLPTA